MWKKVSIWYVSHRLHILVWVLYMLYEGLLLGIGLSDWKSQVTFVSHYIVVIAFFYIHAELVLPISLKSKFAPLLLLLLLGLEVSLYLLLQYLDSVLLIWADISTRPVNFDSQFILRNLYRASLFLGFSTGYYFLKTYLAERKRSAELERQRLISIISQQEISRELELSRNAFLRAQINPHFLFNTLDYVHYNVSEHSPASGEVILRLAEIMRFAIDSGEFDQKTELDQEIQQVKNLLYLYQIKRNDPLPISFNVTSEVRELRLIPLVLLTLVENIFKHGDIASPCQWAQIDLFVMDDNLHIRTENQIGSKSKVDSQHSGLENITKRLRFSYGDHAVFSYWPENGVFNVSLQVALSCLITQSISEVSAANDGR